MPATVIFREATTKPDGSRYEMVVWAVPESEEYPDGVKYSFQYMDSDGETLLRYDNAPYHLDVGRHHRHTSDGTVEAVAYTGVHDLVQQFQTEVTQLYEQRTD